MLVKKYKIRTNTGSSVIALPPDWIRAYNPESIEEIYGFLHSAILIIPDNTSEEERNKLIQALEAI